MLDHFRRFAAAIGVVLLQVLPYSYTPANAQEYEGCFMVNLSGEVVYLNDLCKGQGESQGEANVTGNDQKFIEQYKRLAKRYSPATTDYLLQGANNSPGSKIAIAKKVCADAKAGISLEEGKLKAITEAQKIQNPTDREAFLADMELIMTLAPNYYCPDVSSI